MKEVYGLPKISLSRDRENNIEDCYGINVDFKYPKNLEEFDVCLDFFQRRKEKANTCNDNLMGENTLLGRLIVMDNVSGLTDKSENFANFLTISRKFCFTCVYIFHTIYPTRNNWQMILSQRNIFNIFPGSIQASSVKSCPHTVTDTLTCTYDIQSSGSTDFTLTYLALAKNNA